MDGMLYMTGVPSQSPSQNVVRDPISEKAQEFEAVFIGMVVNEMLKNTTPEEMNGGHGEEMFRSLLGNEIGQEIAQSGGIGIAATIEEKLRAYQK